MKLCLKSKTFIKERNRIGKRVNMDYDNIFSEYNDLCTKELRRKRSVINTQMYYDDFWQKRAGPERLYSFLLLLISLCSLLFSLLSYTENQKDGFGIIVLIAIILVIAVLTTVSYSIRYDKIETIYTKNRLKLEIINQILEERKTIKQSMIKIDLRKYRHR